MTIENIMNQSPILLAFIGTLFTFLLTAIGAALVFLIRKDIKSSMQKAFLGFAGGVMIAASVWSLLIPAIDMAEEQQLISWLPASGGFILGGLFLFILDRILPHLHIGHETPEGHTSSFRRTTMLVLAVTLHNIPEGLAVGLAFGLAAKTNQVEEFRAAIALAIGIGLQNFPEGTAISLPLHKEGLSKIKAFIYGAASAVVEPIAGVLGVILASNIVGIMPWMLAFAAGAMIYVVAEELIPEAHSEKHSHSGTIGVMLGFLMMMILDVALG